MKFGIFDHMDQAGPAANRQFNDRLALAELYEQAGFYAYHVAEHHVTTLGLAPSPLLYLAAVSQRTRRMRIGPLVLPLPLYNPLRLYEEICMLDQISNGRLELGVGKGISPHELAAFGLDPATAQARFQESLDMLRKAFSAESLDHHGEHFSVADVPLPMKPCQNPHPPMWYGVLHPASAGWAARHGMNIVCGAGPVEEIKAVVKAHGEAWQGDEEPLVGMLRQLVIASDEDEARRVAMPAFGAFRRSFTYLWDYRGDPAAGHLLPENMDDLIHRGEAIVGTPERVAERLSSELQECGANYLVCRFAFGDLAQQDIVRSVMLFRDVVMPALEGAMVSRCGEAAS